MSKIAREERIDIHYRYVRDILPDACQEIKLAAVDPELTAQVQKGVAEEFIGDRVREDHAPVPGEMSGDGLQVQRVLQEIFLPARQRHRVPCAFVLERGPARDIDKNEPVAGQSSGGLQDGLPGARGKTVQTQHDNAVRGWFRAQTDFCLNQLLANQITVPDRSCREGTGLSLDPL